MEMDPMRSTLSVILACAAAMAGCAAPHAEPAIPLLFPVEGEYELYNGRNEPVGYVWAETQAPGAQILRWVLLDGYVPPSVEQIGVRRVAQSHESLADFVDFARDLVDEGDHVTYAKSHADTFFVVEDMRRIVPVPVPVGREAPDPPGVEYPYDWPKAARKYQEVDPGTIGIRPGAPTPLPPTGTPSATGGGGPVGGGYLDLRRSEQAGLIGVIVAARADGEEHEDWFIPDTLFTSGLDGTTLLPFANQASPVTSAPSSQWVVVVVNSNYYPGFVPNDW
jgi:hypothetical protein